ncbi:MAG: ParA family protein [Alphaproteobacteria bacterium]|nr:ParA family protein [Alphaproteobacteria bacterium]
MSKTPVIAFVSPKGGAGKTTAALTLASELVHQMERPVTIIDADPNYPFKRWVAQGRKPELLNVVFDESEATILDNIERAKLESRAVIIDLEGTKNMRVTYAVSKADLVIIPLQGSILDANEAAEAIKLIKQTEKGFNRKIEYALLFTRVNAAIVTKNFTDLVRQFADNGIPVLSTRLIEREAYKTMFSTGRGLYDLTDSHVSGLLKAREDSYALAEAVVTRINSHRQQAVRAA